MLKTKLNVLTLRKEQLPTVIFHEPEAIELCSTTSLIKSKSQAGYKVRRNQHNYYTFHVRSLKKFLMSKTVFPNDFFLLLVFISGWVVIVAFQMIFSTMFRSEHTALLMLEKLVFRRHTSTYLNKTA